VPAVSPVACSQFPDFWRTEVRGSQRTRLLNFQEPQFGLLARSVQYFVQFAPTENQLTIPKCSGNGSQSPRNATIDTLCVHILLAVELSPFCDSLRVRFRPAPLVLCGHVDHTFTHRLEHLYDLRLVRSFEVQGRFSLESDISKLVDSIFRILPPGSRQSDRCQNLLARSAKSDPGSYHPYSFWRVQRLLLWGTPALESLFSFWLSLRRSIFHVSQILVSR
jgi:hypothetical protein